MFDARNLDHVAICVPDMEAAIKTYSALLGTQPAHREVVESQKTDACLFELGETSIELIAPRGNASLERFLEKRGPGLHHIAIRVADIDASLARLKADGAPLIDEVARPGARGHRVAFVHPKATGGVLIELVEHTG